MFQRFSEISWWPGSIVLAAICAWPQSAVAQELAPRVFWPTPKGTNLFVAGYRYSTGDIATDAALPVTGAESKVSFAQVTYQRTLSLFDRTTILQVNVPYTRGKYEGFVNGQAVSRNVSAWADTSLQFSVNLLGAPSMDPREFRALAADPQTIIGASIAVHTPSGGYEKDKLINAGANRWSYKLAAGLIWPLRPDWMLEFDLGARFFGDNDDFIGVTRKQDPVYSVEVHLVKRIKPGFWAALDANYYTGGQTTVGQTLNNDDQEASRFGATVAFPIKRRHLIRAAISTGVLTTFAGDYDSYDVSYIYIW